VKSNNLPAGTTKHEKESLRQLVHLLCGGGAFLLYYWPRWAALVLLAVGILLAHGMRRYAEQPERHIPLFRRDETFWQNGAVSYGLGVALAILLFTPLNAFTGWLIFAAGDAASTIAGKQLPLWRLPNGRSVGGALGFATAAFAAAMLGNFWWSGSIGPGSYTRWVCVVIPCAAAELLIPKFDDNYYLPTLAALLNQLLRPS
jgi:dolichol kinase